MESNWWHKNKNKEGERGRGRGRGRPGTATSTGSRPQSAKANTGHGRRGGPPQDRSKAKGSDYVVGNEPWKKPVEILPGSNVVRQEPKPTTITADDSIKGWHLFRKVDPPSKSKSISVVINKPVIGPNGLPEIPNLVLSDHAEIMVDINDAWLHHPRSIGLVMISRILRRKFFESKNPFPDGLFFMVNSHGFNESSTNMPLAFQIISELKDWLLLGEMLNYQKKHLNPTLQMVAFLIGTFQRAKDVLQLVCEVYRLESIRDQLAVHIKELCNVGFYREACYAATFINATAGIGVNHFIIPLILQEREVIAYEYLATHPDMQRDLLGFLAFINESPDVCTALKDYCFATKITGFKLSKFQPKEFAKICSRLRDKYKDCLKLKPSSVEDLVTVVKKEPSRFDSMESYIQGLSAVDPVAIQTMMPKLDWNNIMSDAVAKPYLYSHLEHLPKYTPLQTMSGGFLQTVFKGENYDYYGEVDSSDSEYEFEDGIDDCYYQLPVFPNSYQWIFNPEGVTMFLLELKAAQVVQKERSGRWDDFLIVSLGVKWRIAGKTKEGASLLYVGLPTEVFIIDLDSLQHYMHHTISPWQAIRVFLFLQPGIVKIGYHYARLCALLAKTHPSWALMRDDLKLFIDLAAVSKRVLIKEKNFFPRALNECDLVYYISELVRICFGKSLDHSTVMSNWEKRPLSKKQCHHVVVEGLSVFQVVDFMIRRCNELSLPNLNFNEIVLSVMNSRSIPCDDFFTVKGRCSIFPEGKELDRGMTPKQIQFACGHELQDLGRQLRGAGFDCLITRQLQPPARTVQLASRDDRIIITTSETRDPILDLYPEKLIYTLTSPPGLGQLEEIFRHFRFSLTDTNLFTRCQLCNSTHFVVVRNETMKRLVKRDKRDAFNFPTTRAHISRSIPSCSEYDRQFKNWKLFNEGRLMTEDETNIRTYTGAPIYVNFITPSQLAKIVSFVICEDCGEIYLDESKYELIVGVKSSNTLPSVRVSVSRPGTAASQGSGSVASASASASSTVVYPSRMGFPNYEQEYAFALRAGPSTSRPSTSSSSHRADTGPGPSSSRSEESSATLRPGGSSQYTF